MRTDSSMTPIDALDRAQEGLADVEQHVVRRDLPRHPLAAAGYTSIGCWPCTRPTRIGEDQRAGRWAGTGKTECGLHV